MSGRIPWWRPTIRVRLTLLYAGAFLLAGLVLLALIYFQLGQVLNSQLVVQARIIREPSPVMEQAPPPPPADGVFGEGQELLPGLQSLNAQMQRARRGTLDRMLASSIAFLAVISLVAGLLGWVLAGQALQPLRQITATARRVADRNLHERISLEGPDDEIKDLADTLDSMLERLDRAFDSQQRFIANASHELRTPLAINRTLLEVALLEAAEQEVGADPDTRLRQLAATLLAVNQRHERLIDGLLTLTSSEQGVADRAPVDLRKIADHVIRRFEAHARRAGILVAADLQPAPTSGDAILLERSAENLIENAIRYNLPANGWIRVATRLDGDWAELTVENSGPLVPEYDVPRLFAPFQRLSATERQADSSGPSISRGAGLGLSIVRTVARAHGGDATAAPRADGGLVVRIRIPAAPAGQAPG